MPLTDVPTQTVSWPGNAAGVQKLTIPTMAKYIVEGGDDPGMRSMAGNILRQAGFPKKKRAIAQALLDYVRKAAGYAEDPEFREMVQRATMTLCVDGAPVCIPIGDCDDMTVALGALMRAAGLGVRIAHIQYPSGAQDHVLAAFESDDGQWLNADATTDHPIGFAGHGKRTLIDPLDPAVNPTPYPDGAFIGVGRAPVVGSAMMLPRVFVGAGIVTVDDIVQLAAEVNGQMVSTNTAVQACSAMDASDVQAWQGVFAGWQSVYGVWQQQYQFLQQTPFGTQTIGQLASLPFLPSIQAQMNGFAQQLEGPDGWKAKIVKACPTTYTPPPPVVQPIEIPDGQGPGSDGGHGATHKDWGDQAAQAAKAVGVLFLVGVGAYGLFQVVSIAGAVARAKSAAESIRAPRLSRRAKRRRMAA